MLESEKTLLFVDDDVVFCEVMGRALERHGYIVRLAHNIHEALARADGAQHAVIDLRIGNESGLNLIAQLSAHQAQMQMIVLTGFASIATAVEAVKLGAIHYLTKPTDVTEIVSAFAREEGRPDQPLEQQPMSVNRLEWEHLQRVLQEHNGNISAAARALNMHRRTLQRKLQKHPARR